MLKRVAAIGLLLGLLVPVPFGEAQTPDPYCARGCPEEALCNLKVLTLLNAITTSNTTGKEASRDAVQAQHAQQQMLRSAMTSKDCGTWKTSPLRPDSDTATLLKGEWEGFQTQLEGKSPKTFTFVVDDVSGNIVKGTYNGVKSTGTLGDGTLRIERPAKVPKELSYTIILRRTGWEEMQGVALLGAEVTRIQAGHVLLSKKSSLLARLLELDFTSDFGTLSIGSGGESP